MTTLAAVAALAAPHKLGLLGAFAARADDDLPAGTATVVLLGPAEPGFWAHVTASPEWADRAPDPIDRWSARVIGTIAAQLGGAAAFPFGGPPYRPFYQWALRSGRAFASPVSLLVHDEAGLFVSYRGALLLPERVALPPCPPSPCDRCEGKPCLAACPVGAMGAQGYDVAACHDFLDMSEGQDCLSAGCRVRRACPVSHRYGRVPEQSAYHMRLFHK